MKVAILGTENSHADAFAKLIRDDADFSCLELVGAYGYDPTANERLRNAGLVTRFAAAPDEFLDEVDGVLVTARHGDHHYEYALPYLKAGKAAFIDKPFTVNPAYADEIIEACEASGALVCGGSSLKFLHGLTPLREYAEAHTVISGSVSAPVNMVNDYAGFYFYAQHLIEMLFSVFGTGIRSVYAYCPDPSVNRMSILFDYGSFDVSAHYTSAYEYAVTVSTDKGSQRLATFDLGDCYKQELTEFVEMVKCGKRPHELSDLKKPITLMHAIEDSYTRKKQVEVKW